MVSGLCSEFQLNISFEKKRATNKMLAAAFPALSRRAVLTFGDLEHRVPQIETELHHTQVPEQLAHLRPIPEPLRAFNSKDDIHGAPARRRPGRAHSDIQDLKEESQKQPLKYMKWSMSMKA